MHMTMFEITTLPPDGDYARLRTWLIIAESEADARTLVPAGHRVAAVAAGRRAVQGPSRQIGWLGARLQPAHGRG